jgi:dCMP deaminase
MKDKFVKYFMDVAERTAQLSYATRLQVGTVIVKNNRIISCGYNGMPAGWTPNDCEYPVSIDSVEFSKLPIDEQARFTYNSNKNAWEGLKTYDELIHSEANAISQLARSTESGIGATIICTHSPCLQCAKIIYSSGIKTLYYKNEYRSAAGIRFLEKCGVKIHKIEEENDS